MIHCEHCESPQFLNITRSLLYAPDDETVEEIVEDIECLHCGCTGKAAFDLERDEVLVTGGLTHTTERPTTATTATMRGAAQ